MENFAINVLLLNTSFKTEQVSKHTEQKWTFMKKAMILLESVVHRCSSKSCSQKNSQYAQENTCVGVSGLQACNFIKKRLLHRCFPVNILKFLRTPFFAEHLWWLLFYYLIASRCLAYLAPQQLFDLAWLFLLDKIILWLFYWRTVLFTLFL